MQMLSFLSIPLLIQLYPYIRRGLERTFYKIVFLLSVLIQLSSVVIHFSLETSQAADFQRPVFVVIQRMVNLAALLTGNFERWGLMPHNITSDETRSFTIPRFLPWTIADELPNYVSYALQITWFGGLVILALLVFMFVKNSISGIYDGSQSSDKANE
jgi:hypothetical protein